MNHNTFNLTLIRFERETSTEVMELALKMMRDEESKSDLCGTTLFIHEGNVKLSE